MIVVMQCAGSKEQHAGHMQTTSGQKVRFVAHPACAPPGDFVYAHPDDDSGTGAPWRSLLLQYNESPRENSLGLLRAFELYENDVYRRLARHVGIDNFFILSAGWGLIPASFLTPFYDITFKPKKGQEYKRRRRSDSYRDFQMLPPDTNRAVLPGKQGISAALRIADNAPDHAQNLVLPFGHQAGYARLQCHKIPHVP